MPELHAGHRSGELVQRREAAEEVGQDTLLEVSHVLCALELLRQERPYLLRGREFQDSEDVVP